MATGETAVVTGASAGIGAAIARVLLEQGHDVVTLQRRPPSYTHPRLSFRAVDLSDRTAARQVAAEVAQAHPVRYQVNNAGVNRPGRIEQVTDEDLDQVFSINLAAAIVLAQAFLPGMRAARYGRILNIASRAMLGKVGRAAYATTKAVKAIAPGPVASELFDNGHPPGSAQRQRVIDGVLVGRVGTPEDIAHAAGFLLDRRSGYVTGQLLYVCGGTSVTGTGGQ